MSLSLRCPALHWHITRVSTTRVSTHLYKQLLHVGFLRHVYHPSHATLTLHRALVHHGGTNVPAESAALPLRRELPPALGWATWPLSVSEFRCNASSEPTCFSRNFPERAFPCRPLCSTITTPQEAGTRKELSSYSSWTPPHFVVMERVIHSFMTN